MDTAKSFIVGHPPVVEVGRGNPEAAKYGKMWEVPAYRAHSPGEYFVDYFLLQAKPKSGSRVIDYGCGTGRAGVKLADAGLSVLMIDFVNNSLDPGVREKLRVAKNMSFLKHDLEVPVPTHAEYGFCTDVMEHIPPQRVDLVLNNILRSAKHVFFAISLIDDVCGQAIGEDLHLTVMPYEWWVDKFNSIPIVTHWSDRIGSYAFFYVTAWESAQVAVEAGRINVTEEEIERNIRTNCERGYRTVEPHARQDVEVMIVGNGPSLKDYAGDIVKMRHEGKKLVTLNAAYNWAVGMGLSPSAQVIVDAREFNKRFVQPHVRDCKYLLASQCHPDVLGALPKDSVWMWHSMGERTQEIVREYQDTQWPVPGGCTVLLRSIPLLLMLGFHRFHIFGCDSCIMDGEHHFVSQPENDGQQVIPMMLTGGKVFYCHPWMAAQAKEFMNLIEKLGDMFDMIAYGNGLLAQIINTGASLALEEET